MCRDNSLQHQTNKSVKVKALTTLNPDQKRLHQLDTILRTSSRHGRQRLSTYFRRYLSPLIIEELFNNGQLEILTRDLEVNQVTVISGDVQGFTPHTKLAEQRGFGVSHVADTLAVFYSDVIETVFEYGGVMGEFSGDGFMAFFGIPTGKPDDADRAVLAAIDIYCSAARLNRSLKINRRHHLSFDIGLGIHSGGPIWIGDLGTRWRRELSIIGSVLNASSRIEELTRNREFAEVEGHNIIVSGACIEKLSDPLREHLLLEDFPARPLRGLGEENYSLSKLIGEKSSQRPGETRYRIDQATRETVNAIAQLVESVQERENSGHLQNIIRDIGYAITSSVEIDTILESVLKVVYSFLNASTASIFLCEEKSEHLKVSAVRPYKYYEQLQSLEFIIGEGIVGYVAQTQESVLIDDTRDDERFNSIADSMTGYQTRSVLCVPIVAADTLIGVLQVLDDQPSKFTVEDLHILESMAFFAASAFRIEAQYKQNRQVAETIIEAATVAELSFTAKGHSDRLKLQAQRIRSVSSELRNLLKEGISLDIGTLNKILSEIEGSVESVLSISTELNDTSLIDNAGELPSNSQTDLANSEKEQKSNNQYLGHRKRISTTTPVENQHRTYSHANKADTDGATMSLSQRV